MHFIISISMLLVIIAGLNLGFIGFFGVNPIECMITDAFVLQLTYAVIGFAALIIAIAAIKGGCLCMAGCSCGCNCNEEGCSCTKEAKQKEPKAKK